MLNHNTIHDDEGLDLTARMRKDSQEQMIGKHKDLKHLTECMQIAPTDRHPALYSADTASPSARVRPLESLSTCFLPPFGGQVLRELRSAASRKAIVE